MSAPRSEKRGNYTRPAKVATRPANTVLASEGRVAHIRLDFASANLRGLGYQLYELAYVHVLRQ